MRAGEFPDGAHVLRAKIDMASPNINMRDPVLYRIRHATHHRTGDTWCIYPMYDFAHRCRTRIEGITHSICTLEFEDHRPLYDWVLDTLGDPVPPAADRVRAAEPHLHGDEQAQAARAGAGAARRRLGRSAHADARRACAGAATRRRRSATSASASAWPSATASSTWRCSSTAVREDLNRRAPRVMAVLRPLQVVIENYPEGQVEELDAVNNPEDAGGGHAQGAVLARALHRARRLPRGSAEEVLPPRPGPRGAAALRLLHHLHRGR